MLALVDALREDRVRERQYAEKELFARLGAPLAVTQRPNQAITETVARQLGPLSALF